MSNTRKTQISALYLTDDVVTEVYGGGGEGNAVYGSGDGITVDNDNYTIYVDSSVARDTDIKDVVLSVESVSAIANGAQSTASSAKSKADEVQTALGTETARATDAEGWISAKVDAKIKINDTSAETLSISSIDADAYYAQLAESQSKDTQLKFKDNKLYVLTSNDGYMNVGNQRVGNMADPTDSKDAVTLNHLTSNYVDNHSDQVIAGAKTFTNTFAIGTDVNGKGNACMGIGQNLSVGQNNFFYKGIEHDTTTEKLSIYLCPQQPRYPYPFYRKTDDISSGTFNIGGQNVKPDDEATWATLSGGPYQMKDNTLTSNVKNTKHCMLCATWLCQFETTGANWSLNDYNTHDVTKLYYPVRNDYNQLSIDVPGYIKNGSIDPSKVNAVKTKLNEYYLSAFTPEASTSSLTACLHDKIGELRGKEFTMVNDWKTNYIRCGTVENILSDSVLVVQLYTTKPYNSYPRTPDAYKCLKDSGILFSDFDYDEASIRFVDNPELSGPAADVTNASIAVGSLNQVFGRDSLVVGKECYAEGDHSIALGRRARARDYVSFVWSPDCQKAVTSPGDGTFTVGVATLNDAYKQANNRTLKIADRDGKFVDIATFIVNCISCDSNLKNALKTILNS